MNIELTEKEFRRLLDLVYVGNWVLNSARGNDRFADYDFLQEKLFGLCAEHDMNALITRWYGHVFPSQAYETAASTRRSRTMRTRCSSTFWPRSWPAGIWTTCPSTRATTRS